MNRGQGQSYGSYILSNKEELLKQRRKKIKAKRTGIILIILTTILITLCLTLPVFNISEILVKGNSIVSLEELNNLIGVTDGENIFKFRTSTVVNNLKTNPYIADVKVRRKLPNKLSVTITERQVAFYVATDSGFYIFDEKGVFLEKRDNVDGMTLIKLDGINVDESSLVAGEPIVTGVDDKLKSLSTIYEFLRKNSLLDSYSASALEVNDFVSMKLYVNNFYIKLGTADDLFNKLSTAFNIIESSQLSELKGYIDVSYNGNPVIYREPEEEEKTGE